tara:strand:- start:666 stop:2450 length:1785 start_codon:yes stop_codon:yes gene_type:complete
MPINFPDSPSVDDEFSVGDRTWKWNSVAWQVVGNVLEGPTGPDGPAGPQGPGFVFRGTVASEAELPAAGNTENDAYILTTTQELFAWDGTQWVNVGDISGPTGPTGATGVDGVTGPTGPIGINWLGTWDSTVTYAINDAVERNNGSYIATASTTNEDPETVTASWEVLAGAGAGSGGGSVDVANTVDATTFVGLYEDASGSIGGKTSTGIVYDASTEKLTVTSVETSSLQPPDTLVGTYTISSPTSITLNPTTETISSGPLTLANKTESQRLALSPSSGAVVYDTTNTAIYVWSGTAWAAVGSGGGGGTGATGPTGPTGPTGAASTVAGPTGAQGGITYSVVNNASGNYVINGASNPTLSFIRGHRYIINVNASGHPFWIQTVSGAYSAANVYNTGVTNNGAESGTIIIEVAFDAPQLYYACQYHSSMQGSITVSDLGPTGADGADGATTFNALSEPTLAAISIDQVAYPAASMVSVTNSGNQYNFSFPYSGSNPALYAYRGLTIAFKLSVSGHPFQIQSDPAGGSSYSNVTVGLVHVATNGAVSTGSAAQLKTSGTLYFTLPYDIAGTSTTLYRYICSIHSSMVNSITPLQGQ